MCVAIFPYPLPPWLVLAVYPALFHFFFFHFREQNPPHYRRPIHIRLYWVAIMHRPVEIKRPIFFFLSLFFSFIDFNWNHWSTLTYTRVHHRGHPHARARSSPAICRVSSRVSSQQSSGRSRALTMGQWRVTTHHWRLRLSTAKVTLMRWQRANDDVEESSITIDQFIYRLS